MQLKIKSHLSSPVGKALVIISLLFSGAEGLSASETSIKIKDMDKALSLMSTIFWHQWAQGDEEMKRAQTFQDSAIKLKGEHQESVKGITELAQARSEQKRREEEVIQLYREFFNLPFVKARLLSLLESNSDSLDLLSLFGILPDLGYGFQNLLPPEINWKIFEFLENLMKHELSSDTDTRLKSLYDFIRLWAYNPSYSSSISHQLAKPLQSFKIGLSTWIHQLPDNKRQRVSFEILEFLFFSEATDRAQVYSSPFFRAIANTHRRVEPSYLEQWTSISSGTFEGIGASREELTALQSVFSEADPDGKLKKLVSLVEKATSETACEGFVL